MFVVPLSLPFNSHSKKVIIYIKKFSIKVTLGYYNFYNTSLTNWYVINYKKVIQSFSYYTVEVAPITPIT